MSSGTDQDEELRDQLKRMLAVVDSASSTPNENDRFFRIFSLSLITVLMISTIVLSLWMPNSMPEEPNYSRSLNESASTVNRCVDRIIEFENRLLASASSPGDLDKLSTSRKLASVIKDCQTAIRSHEKQMQLEQLKEPCRHWQELKELQSSIESIEMNRKLNQLSTFFQLKKTSPTWLDHSTKGFLLFLLIFTGGLAIQASQVNHEKFFPTVFVPLGLLVVGLLIVGLLIVMQILGPYYKIFPARESTLLTVIAALAYFLSIIASAWYFCKPPDTNSWTVNVSSKRDTETFTVEVRNESTDTVHKNTKVDLVKVNLEEKVLLPNPSTKECRATSKTFASGKGKVLSSS